jgi:DNA-binding beta-propeller fold protein YncE
MRAVSTRPWLFALLAVLACIPSTARADFHVLRTVTLGGEGGWDFVTVDGPAHRLYIPRSTHVMVVDIDSMKVIGDLPDTPGVHGVALVPERGLGYISNGRDTSVTIFDLKTLRATGKVRVGMGPDAIVYDSASKRIFTLNGRSGDATAIDVATGRVVGTIPLGGKPEVPACDGKGRMYVNIEDSSAVVVVDTKALKVVGRWSLSPGEEPTGIALDDANHLLFSSCSNQKLVVTDTRKGVVVGTVPIGDRVDGAAIDLARKLVFTSNGEGTLTVVHEDSPTRFSVAATVPTALGARTLALDPQAHRIYLVTAQFGTAPAPTAEQPHPRPPLVPGTFQVIVVGE